MAIMPTTTGGSMKGDRMAVRTRPRTTSNLFSASASAVPSTSCRQRAMAKSRSVIRSELQKTGSVAMRA